MMNRAKKLHLRHLSTDCKNLLHKADKFIEVSVIDDPNYEVAVDYAEMFGKKDSLPRPDAAQTLVTHPPYRACCKKQKKNSSTRKEDHLSGFSMKEPYKKKLSSQTAISSAIIKATARLRTRLCRRHVQAE